MPLIGNNAGTVFPGGVDSFNAAYDPSIGPALQQLQGTEGFFPPNTLSGIVSQSLPDAFTTTVTGTLTGGTVYQAPLFLRAGQTVTNLSYFVGTGSSTPSHQWLGLAFPAGLSGAAATAKCVAITADGLTSVHAANALVTTALTSAYVVPTTGYYIAFLCIAGTNGGTVSGYATMGTAGRGSVAPWPFGVGDTGLSTPYAVGATVGATTAAAAAMLIYAN